MLSYLTLGIPGNAASAMIFAALMIQGITPGPFLVAEHPDIFWGVIASMYIGNAMLLVLNLPMVGLWVQMLRVPYGILAPIIILFTTIGVYNVQNQVFDIYSMFSFAAVGYGMRKLKFDPAPLPLAFVLGPMVERSLRQSLLISAGDHRISLLDPKEGLRGRGVQEDHCPDRPADRLPEYEGLDRLPAEGVQGLRGYDQGVGHQDLMPCGEHLKKRGAPFLRRRLFTSARILGKMGTALRPPFISASGASGRRRGSDPMIR